jgi:hypothetical protein
LMKICQSRYLCFAKMPISIQIRQLKGASNTI